MKKILCVLCVLTLCVSITACGGDIRSKAESLAESIVEEAAEPETVEETEVQTSTPKEAKTEIQTEAETEAKTEAETEAETVSVENIPVIKIGEAIEIPDTCEFSIDFANITKDVMPPSPGSFYSHYEADDGKAFVDVCVAYKNLESSEKMADETVSGMLKYDNNYEFTGFSIIEKDNRGSFTYSNITGIAPLSTEYVHYLFEVPEEVADGGLLEAILNVGGNDYKLVVQEGNGSAAARSENKELSKTSGEIKNGETIVTENSEFNIDYSNIAKDIVPPKPDSFYSHYEADDGKSFVDVCVAYKNTAGTGVDADEVINAKMKYADKYDYNGFSMIEKDNRSDFTYSNITTIAPLSTEYIHYLFEVPEEVADSADSIVIDLVVDGNTYTYKMR